MPPQPRNNKRQRRRSRKKKPAPTKRAGANTRAASANNEKAGANTAAAHGATPPRQQRETNVAAFASSHRDLRVGCRSLERNRWVVEVLGH